MKPTANELAILGLLNILARQASSGARWIKEGNQVVITTQQGTRTFDPQVLDNARSNGLITTDADSAIITRSGKAKLKRHLCDHDPYTAQHRQLDQSIISIEDYTQTVTFNVSESPLARLYVRKQKDGSRFITRGEYEAGERLRRDFERAGLQPSISVSWQQRVSTGTKSYRGDGSNDFSNLAMDARGRLEKAVNNLGPELSGVALDVCCFLKGFELVERERRWPSRSAKLMLKTALSKLSRHYGFASPTKFHAKSSKGRIGHWGTSDYRPNL